MNGNIQGLALALILVLLSLSKSAKNVLPCCCYLRFVIKFNGGVSLIQGSSLEVQIVQD